MISQETLIFRWFKVQGRKRIQTKANAFYRDKLATASMLSKGQRRVLIEGVKENGDEAGYALTRNVSKTTRTKIYDAARDLQDLYEQKQHEFGDLIRREFSWLIQDVAGSPFVEAEDAPHDDWPDEFEEIEEDSPPSPQPENGE